MVSGASDRKPLRSGLTSGRNKAILLKMIKDIYIGVPYGDERRSPVPQGIPGKVMCAYFDIGGEGISYHAHSPINQGSGKLNPPDGSYLNGFRIEVLDQVGFPFSNCWAARTNEFALPTTGAPPDLRAFKASYDAYIKDGVGSQKYRSFTIDTSSIETEYAACQNAHRQYWFPLELALVDIRSGLVEYEERMKAAGIERVREVLQAQLDAYLREIN